jgi:hypothetical protein
VVLLDELDALLGWIDEGVANSLEYFRRFEKAVEIAVVDGGLRVEKHSHLL